MKTIRSLTFLVLFTVLYGTAQTGIVTVAYNTQTKTNDLISIDSKTGAINLLPNASGQYSGLAGSTFYDGRTDQLVNSTSDFDRYRNSWSNFRLQTVDLSSGSLSGIVKTGLKLGNVIGSNKTDQVNVIGGANPPGFFGGTGTLHIERVNLATGAIRKLANYPSMSLARDAVYVSETNSAFVMTTENSRYQLIEFDMSNGTVIRRLKQTLQTINVGNLTRDAKIAYSEDSNLLYLAGTSKSNANQIVVSSFNVRTGDEKVIYSENTSDSSRKITSLLFDGANNQLVARIEQRGNNGFDVTLNTVDLASGSLSQIVGASSSYNLRYIDLFVRASETVIDPDPDPDPDTKIAANLSITLDNYPEETSWRVLAENGSVVTTSKGTYRNQADGATVTEKLELESGCYVLEILDSYGDGICCGYGNGSYTLTAESKTLASGGSFGRVDKTSFCVGTNRKAPEITSDDDYAQPLSRIKVYPTAASQTIHLDYKIKAGSQITVSLLDISGRIITKDSFDSTANNDISFDVSRLSSGSYFLKVDENGNANTEKFVIVR